MIDDGVQTHPVAREFFCVDNRMAARRFNDSSMESSKWESINFAIAVPDGVYFWRSFGSWRPDHKGKQRQDS
jgi:hypothetical protein